MALFWEEEVVEGAEAPEVVAVAASRVDAALPQNLRLRKISGTVFFGWK